jgi:SPW repeat
MSTFSNKLVAQWKDGGDLVLGLWLAISPWALSYAHEASPAWNAQIVGIVIAVAALTALAAFQKWEEWIKSALGAWLIVSPFILGFSTAGLALWSQLIVGVLVGGLALWAALTDSNSEPIKI